MLVSKWSLRTARAFTVLGMGSAQDQAGWVVVGGSLGQYQVSGQCRLTAVVSAVTAARHNCLQTESNTRR